MNNTITHVFIGQLLRALDNMENDQILLDGQVVDRLQILGQIERCVQIENQTVLYIDDGTGVLPVVFLKKFDQERPTALAGLDYKEDIYIQGIISYLAQSTSQKEQYKYIGLKFQPLQNYNQITMHILQATQSQMRRQMKLRGPKTTKEIKKGSVKDEILSAIQQLKRIKGNNQITFRDIQQQNQKLDEDELRIFLSQLIKDGKIYNLGTSKDVFGILEQFNQSFNYSR